jgi:hypothetical protein
VTHQITLGADIDREFQQLLSKLYSDDTYGGPPPPNPAVFESNGRRGGAADLWQLLRVMRSVSAAGQGTGASAAFGGGEGWELGPRDLNQGSVLFGLLLLFRFICSCLMRSQDVGIVHPAILRLSCAGSDEHHHQYNTHSQQHRHNPASKETPDESSDVDAAMARLFRR